MTWLCETAETKTDYKEPQEDIAVPNHWTIKENNEIKHQQMQNTYGDMNFKLIGMIMGFKPHTITQSDTLKTLWTFAWKCQLRVEW